MRATPLLAGTAVLLATAAGCHVDDLVDAPPTGMIVATPAAVQVTAAVGSSAPRTVALALRSVHNDAVGWTVTRTGDGGWLQVENSAGTTPDTLRLTLDPAGAGAQRQTDTLIVTPDDPEGAPTRVIVTLILEDCAAGSIAAGVAVTDSLRASDCASTHRPGRPARRYRITGEAGDSVSLHLTSTTLPVVLIADTTDAAGATPLAETSTCVTEEGACLVYLRLPPGGALTAEVTTSGSGTGFGPFALRLSVPRTPADPDSLRQTRSDSTSIVSVGGAVPEPEVVIRGILRDPDLSDTLRLEVELQPVGTSFTGEATASGGPTRAGSIAFVRITGLVDGGRYHWRWRVLDQTGRSTPWRAFGANPESAPDLRVAVEADRLQFRQAPTTTAAGAPMTPPIEVTAVDRDGAIVVSFTGTITLSLGSGPAGAALSGDRSVTAVAGVATFAGLSLDKTGTSYTLVASSSGMVDATSPVFAITPGAATRLAFTQQPTSSSPNAPITPAVEVTAYDGYGNLATTFTGPVTISIGRDGSLLQDAVLSGTATQNAAAGVARFTDLSIDQPGSGYTLVATSTGLSSSTSDAFAIVPLGGSPSEQSFGQQPTSASAGEIIAPPVTVRILDALGQVVTDFTDPVTLTLVDGPTGAILGGTTSVVASEGVARFGDLRVDRAGSGYRLRASTSAVPDVTSAPFDITAAPPTTGAVTVTTTSTGVSVDFDGYTVVVAGVSRTVPANGTTTYGGLTAGSYPVALGDVAANCIVAGDNPRSATVVAGDTARVDFTISCASIPPPPSATRLSFTAQPPALLLIGSGFGVSVAGLDTQGSLVPGFAGEVSLTLVGGAPGVTLTGTTRRNAVNGTAGFSGLGVSGPCVACQIQATASGLASATSGTFTVALPGLAQ